MEKISSPYQRINTDKRDRQVVTHHVYKRRWLVLMSFSMLTCSNALLWNSFSPIALIAMDYFKTTPTAINALSLLFLFIYVPGAFVGSYCYTKLGLKKGIFIGVVLNTVGSWLRWIGCIQPFFPSPQARYGIVFAGQALGAAAQSFIYQAPPLLASNWFPPTERTTATSAGSLANQLGIALGFILSSALVDTASQLPFFMILSALSCTLAGVLFIFFFQSAPALPPTAMAASAARKDESASYWQPYWIVLKNRDFVLLLVAFSISLGCIFALSTLLDQLLHPLQYTNDDSGVFGLLTIMVGIGAALLLGVITDRTRTYKLWLLLTFAGCALAYALFAALLLPAHVVLMGVLCSLVGFFNTALAPVSLEAAVELTYPANEEVSSTLLTNGANLLGMALILGLAPLLTAGQPRVFLALLAALNAAGFVLLVLMRPRYKRLMAEQEHTKPLLD